MITMTDQRDHHFMHRALELARATVGLASPNPQVGCVLVHGEELLAEGAHLYDARDHAEIAALRQAAERGHSAEGVTAYVTLEPCSHHGRTGPCADALIAAKIARCVVATVDPNPLVGGQGIAKLRAAGIDVTLGVLEQQARDLNNHFAHFVQTRRPFVTLKAALSVDGKLAPPAAQRKPGQPHWLTGPESRAEVHRLRHASDALLTGIGTVLADDPTLTDRSGILGPGGQPRRRPLLRVVLDTHLRLPLTSQLVRSAANDLLIVCSAEAPPRNIAALAANGIEVLPVAMHPAEHNGHLSLAAVLKELARRNLLSVLLEAGSQLNGAFLAQRLVDKAVLFYAETELGDGALPFATGIPSPFLFEQSLRRVTRTTFGPDACVTGYLNYPWPPA
jgi:diaminohydroxyphosphoribosylaminopyrimidine deaminase/5-amino-6-(5-phosphoribosylamino)uracil reductase